MPPPQGPQGPGYGPPPQAGSEIQAGCTFRAGDLQERAPGAAYIISCPPGCAAADIAIWGSGPYTADSGVCRAAIHAGASSDQQGGTFQVVIDRGQPAYRGTVQNGVATKDYGAWGESFWIQAPQ